MSSELKFDANSVEWHQNKIKGGIAESACRAHFEALGYAVESTGIEHIAPQYSRLQGYSQGHYISDVKKIQKMPDFLISRVHPLNLLHDKYHQSGKADAVFVEAKYRTEAELDKFTQDIFDDYEPLLKKGIHFIVYLVCKRYKETASSEVLHTGGFVLLNFFNPQVSNTKKDTGWYKAGDKIFSTLPLYQGICVEQDFNRAYTKIVQPVLSEILA